MDRSDRPQPADVLTRTLLTVEEYRDELLTQVACLRSNIPAQDIPVTEAIGRVLAEDVRARVPVPAFDNSAMDGFAVRWQDIAELPARLSVTADIPAGALTTPTFGPGECARIMTGAPVPECADTIVPLEQVNGDAPGAITVVEHPGPGRGAFIRRRGASLDAGTVVASAGTSVTAGVVAAVVAVGVGTLRVARRPRVGIVSTGDELMAPGTTLAFGQIHDVNTPYLAGVADRLGGDVTTYPALPDDVDSFTAGLARAAEENDLVVVSGGASVGDHDVARMVLGSRNASAFRHVRMQPGKPQGWAMWGDALIVSVPGNPLSAAVSVNQFVAPLVDALSGRQFDTGVQRAVASGPWTSPAGRCQYVPGVLTTTPEGESTFATVHAHGSASYLTTVLAQAEVLAVVPAEVTNVSTGDVLDIVALR